MTPSRSPGSEPSRSSLFRHSDFRRFWMADSVSQAGAAVTLVALPLVAIGPLDATPFQTGLLTVFEYLAFLVIGLPAGAWVDRVRRRPVMTACVLTRAVLLASIPVAYWLDVLTMGQLYLAASGISVCTVFFDVAYQSYLPHLVGDGGRLLEANVKLEATRNIAQVGGPGVGGVLVGALTAPVAVVVDTAGFVASALLLSRIRSSESEPRGRPGAGLGSEIAEGLRFVFGNPLLRAITLTAAISNLAAMIGASMMLVLLNGELGLSPSLCGLLFTAEAVGGLLGSMLTTRIAARVGQGPAMCLSVIVSGVLWLLALPMFQSDWRFAVGVVLQGLGWVAFMTFKINSVVFRQQLCPRPLLGRMTASVRFVVWGGMPLGALAGSVLGQSIGVRQAMWVGASGELLAVLPMLLSPLRTMRELAGTTADADDDAPTALTGPSHDGP
ncbi:MFS transporter [Streptomyces sp. Go40/10]|uniref:MFS transporter n=1 Tax=Streptomyces sp. Go40/10 TaxID=2825844 RepID=UPI001E338915|nr:MFS transporter [Streptomyces sp. Go40/10]UFR06894.1 MFS transporter [Streptomyces sp. Go40/10]